MNDKKSDLDIAQDDNGMFWVVNSLEENIAGPFETEQLAHEIINNIEAF